jgi:hypothetical protein
MSPPRTSSVNPGHLSTNATAEREYRRPLGRPRDARVQQDIAALDARRDCQQIVRLLVAYEFPFDLQRALEIALFHTYGSQSVARVLDRTGEFRKRGQRRYDDTRLLIGHFLEEGWDSTAGARAIAQMNHIHSFYKIPNDDYLFVLWTFIDFPIQWMRDFGWRAFTEQESEAWFHFWCQVGSRMGLREIPKTKADFDIFVRAYEAREFVANESSQRVAGATLSILEAWLPRPLRPLLEPVAMSLMRPQLLPAIGHEPPPAWITKLVHGALKTRARIKRYVSLEPVPSRLANSLNRTYPGNRYTIESLGPEHARRRSAASDPN